MNPIPFFHFLDEMIAEYGVYLLIAFAHASIVLVVVLRIYFSQHPPRSRAPFTIIVLPLPPTWLNSPEPPRLPPPVLRGVPASQVNHRRL